MSYGKVEVVEFKGLLSSAAPELIDDGAARDIMNLRQEKAGKLVSRDGTSFGLWSGGIILVTRAFREWNEIAYLGNLGVYGIGEFILNKNVSIKAFGLNDRFNTDRFMVYAVRAKGERFADDVYMSYLFSPLYGDRRDHIVGMPMRYWYTEFNQFFPTMYRDAKPMQAKSFLPGDYIELLPPKRDVKSAGVAVGRREESNWIKNYIDMNQYRDKLVISDRVNGDMFMEYEEDADDKTNYRIKLSPNCLRDFDIDIVRLDPRTGRRQENDATPTSDGVLNGMGLYLYELEEAVTMPVKDNFSDTFKNFPAWWSTDRAVEKKIPYRPGIESWGEANRVFQTGKGTNGALFGDEIKAALVDNPQATTLIHVVPSRWVHTQLKDEVDWPYWYKEGKNTGLHVPHWEDASCMYLTPQFMNDNNSLHYSFSNKEGNMVYRKVNGDVKLKEDEYYDENGVKQISRASNHYIWNDYKIKYYPVKYRDNTYFMTDLKRQFEKKYSASLRTTELNTKDAFGRKVPLGVWRYKFVWDFGEGVYSAPSAELWCPDMVWSAVREEELYASATRPYDMAGENDIHKRIDDNYQARYDSVTPQQNPNRSPIIDNYDPKYRLSLSKLRLMEQDPDMMQPHARRATALGQKLYQLKHALYGGINHKYGTKHYAADELIGFPMQDYEIAELMTLVTYDIGRRDIPLMGLCAEGLYHNISRRWVFGAGVAHSDIFSAEQWKTVGKLYVRSWSDRGGIVDTQGILTVPEFGSWYDRAADNQYDYIGTLDPNVVDGKTSRLYHGDERSTVIIEPDFFAGLTTIYEYTLEGEGSPPEVIEEQEGSARSEANFVLRVKHKKPWWLGKRPPGWQPLLSVRPPYRPDERMFVYMRAARNPAERLILTKTRIDPQAKERLILKGMVELNMVDSQKGQILDFIVAYGAESGEPPPGGRWRNTCARNYLMLPYMNERVPGKGDPLAMTRGMTYREAVTQYLQDITQIPLEQDPGVGTPADRVEFPLQSRPTRIEQDETLGVPWKNWNKPCVDVRVYGEGERLIGIEQLTSYFASSILFNSPRMGIRITAADTPKKAKRLLIFRTLSTTDNNFQPDSYGLVKVVNIERGADGNPLTRDVITGTDTFGNAVLGDWQGIYFFDNITDAMLDFTDSPTNYEGSRRQIKSRFNIPLNERVFYLNYIEEYQPIAPRSKWGGNRCYDEYGKDDIPNVEFAVYSDINKVSKNGGFPPPSGPLGIFWGISYKWVYEDLDGNLGEPVGPYKAGIPVTDPQFYDGHRKVVVLYFMPGKHDATIRCVRVYRGVFADGRFKYFHIGNVYPEDEGVFVDDNIKPREAELTEELTKPIVTEYNSGMCWSEPYRPDWIKPDNMTEYKAGDGKQITGVESLYGNLLIMKETSMHREAVQAKDPPISRRDEVTPEIGCIAPNACINVNNTIYFLSWKGVYKYDNNVLQPIDLPFAEELQYCLAHGKVNEQIRDAGMGFNPFYNEIYLNMPLMERKGGDGRRYSESITDMYAATFVDLTGDSFIRQAHQRSLLGHIYVINLEKGYATKFSYPATTIKGDIYLREVLDGREMCRMYYLNTLGELRSGDIMSSRYGMQTGLGPFQFRANEGWVWAGAYLESPRYDRKVRLQSTTQTDAFGNVSHTREYTGYGFVKTVIGGVETPSLSILEELFSDRDMLMDGRRMRSGDIMGERRPLPFYIYTPVESEYRSKHFTGGSESLIKRLRAVNINMFSKGPIEVKATVFPHDGVDDRIENQSPWLDETTQIFQFRPTVAYADFDGTGLLEGTGKNVLKIIPRTPKVGNYRVDDYAKPVKVAIDIKAKLRTQINGLGLHWRGIKTYLG